MERLAWTRRHWGVMGSGATTLGPCIVVGEVHSQAVDVQTRVNDQLRRDYNTRDMVWSFGEERSGLMGCNGQQKCALDVHGLDVMGHVWLQHNHMPCRKIHLTLR